MVHTPRLVALLTLLAACGTPPRPAATPATVARVAAAPVDPDGDGVAGEADRCPDAPEDCDGVDDADGCPDPDDDHDGVTDACDACPDEAGAPPDGCVHRVVVESSEIRILPEVYFTRDAATPGRESLPVIDAVAETMRQHPELLRVELAGSAHPGEEDPQRLSQARAEAVLALLVARRIEASRLVARGDGVRTPVVPNTTAAGRARNRRVTFRVLDFAQAPSPRATTTPRRVVAEGCPDAPAPPPRGPCTPGR